MPLLFYPGLHQPSDAGKFERACISINRIRVRRKPIKCPHVLVDSGAFTELHLYGRYRQDVSFYARDLLRLHSDGIVNVAAAVAQDYMCEPFMLAKTRLSVSEHQHLTIERYDDLVAALSTDGELPFPLMPVLQGYAPTEYVRHARLYGSRLHAGMWVGVGSVCKRNSTPERVLEVLAAIASVRPDLRLHGFGVKLTSLANPGVRALLYSADSMAWSFAARRQGRNQNCWREAVEFTNRVVAATNQASAPWQLPFVFEYAAERTMQ